MLGHVSEKRRGEQRGDGYAVPQGRPYLLAEFRTKLAAVNSGLSGLYNDSHPAEFDATSDAVYVLFHIARNLAPARTYTGCERHPNGAIDPEPPQGWTRCLLCNEARRLGTNPANIPPVARTSSLGFPVPDGPYSFDQLSQLLRRVNELAFELSLRSDDADFARFADATHQAFIVARELARPRNTSGCDIHPGAPTDPTADNACLFCVAARRRRQDEQNNTPVMITRPRRSPVPRRPRPFPPGAPG